MEKRVNKNIYPDRVGHVVKENVPMFISFNEKDVAFVVESLANAIDTSYKVFAMFSPDDPSDPEGGLIE